MRPAWLPPTSPPASARDVPRPRSAAASPRDAMVHSARQLLHESPVDDAPPLSLQDFMDSFPLVPLAVIPRLPLADLIECEGGLIKLYHTLAVDTSAEDAQLAQYVTRQLGLVQRQLEQLRARERVLKMLSGELPVAATPLPPLSTHEPQKPLPVFLQPSSQQTQPSPSSFTPSPSQRPTSAREQPALASTKSMGALNNARKNDDVLARARAQARLTASATATTAFVITTSETSMKARQRRKRMRKKTPEQLEEERVRRQEREKELRRQAAYQRLMARQELQAKKKQDATHKKPAPATSALPSTTSSFIDVTVEVASAISDSEASDVSNCSETDAADEKAIMAMEVTVTPTPENDAIEADECGDDEDELQEDDTASHAPGEEEETQDRDDDPVPPAERGGDLEGTTASTMNVANTYDLDQLERIEDEAERPEIDEVAHDSEPEEPQESDIEEQAPGETNEQRDQRTRDEITEQLHEFMASRKQAALDKLHRDANERRATAPILPPSRPSTAQPAASPPRTPAPKHAAVPVESPQQVQDPVATEITQDKSTPKPAQRHPAKRVASKESQPLAVSRPLGKDTKDYRGYFANFFCILTSVFEQRAAISASSSASSSSSSSLLLAPAAPSGDNALRQQLKLYQSWQTIMDDYATVFGNTSCGLVSAATAHYRINSQSRAEVSDIVVTALEKLGGWDEHPSGLGLKTTWNLLWTWSKPNVERKTLLAWQKVNHFQHAKHLTRKDCLKKTLAKYAALGGRLKQAFDIAPASFLLPQEYVAFVQAFHERARVVPPGKNIWIMKPVALSRGRGISLVNDLHDVVYGEQVVIQEYIANPLLLDGFKFDLRLYVLVTSFNPLEVFFYEDGFVRMCTRAYEDADLTNLFVHLTNSSIQKENQDAITNNPANPIHGAEADDAGGTKMTLAYLWKRLAAMGADVAAVQHDIKTVILKALVCGEDHIPFQVNSFDLYGYDILLDTNFRPWLIEINSSPSMARENVLDHQVKDALMYDTLKLVDPLHFDRTRLVEVIARRFQDAETDKKRLHANTRHPREMEELATRQLNEDLTEILRGKVPRAYGEVPAHMGSYTRLAPHTLIHNQLVKLKKSCLRLDRK